MIRRTLSLLVILLLLVNLSVLAETVDREVTKAIKGLLAHEDIDRNADIIRNSSISGAELYKQLSKPPKFSDKEKKGMQVCSVELEEGYSLKYAFTVPGGYKASKPVPVIFILHGGVTSPQPVDPSQLYSSMAGSYAGILGKAKEDFIIVAPQGSDKAPWWNANGSKMVMTALFEIKRRYNVDTNRVYVTGFSDGGSGSFFNAAFNTSHFAASFPMNGMMSNAGGGGYTVFVENFRNRPIFICNTTEDSLYPPKYTQPVADALKDAGVDLYFRMFEKIPHRFDYAPQIADDMAKWLKEKVRDPWRKQVELATADPVKSGHMDWLVIDELGSTETSVEFKPIAIQAEGRAFFGSRGGYARAEREGNSFTVSTNGVKKLRIGVSPDSIDIKKPVVVTANGKQVFEGMIEMDAKDVLDSYLFYEDYRTLVCRYISIEIP